MVWCSICGKSFHNVSNLRVHVKKFHPDKLDEIAPKKSNNFVAACNDCGKTFSKYSNLTRHVKIFHPERINDLTKPKEYTYECEECGKHFMNLYSFNFHTRNHSNENTDIRKEPLLKCSLCNDDENFTKTDLFLHLEAAHDIKLNSSNLKFPNREEFSAWKKQMEKETRSCFINKHGSYKTKSCTKIRFICNRSGMYKPEGSGARHLKVQGSSKLNGFCPAEITVKIKNSDEYEVEFIDHHIGHSNDLGHLTLTSTERESIAAKIAAKIPFQTILDEIRESISGDKLDRIHLLTKKDLYNIEQCFHLNNEAVRHAKDALSVDAWVREVENTGCVLFYKTQDSLCEEHPHLKQEDFVLIIMNQGQTEMLEKYGSDCICIDGTHGLNAYQFELVTLLVLDDLREGFPCAFFISNRTDESVMSLFFFYIKKRLGRNLTPNIFMSDMAPAFYNAWLHVMEPVQYRLFCSWHVDRAWRKNLSKISAKEEQINVYRMLRVLVQETDVNAFTPMCDNFLEILKSNSHTVEFCSYFREHYLKNIQSWAYCYRVNCGINTNMHLERMHRTLKYIYLNGKVVKRLDKVVNVLMKFVRDKLFERLIVINKGKISTKIQALRNRHKVSEQLDYTCVVKTDKGFEVPSSSTNEIYLVEKRQSVCNCKLVCNECQVCLHHYSCTCIESCIKWNMCKHIHLVCRFLMENEKQVDTSLPITESVAEENICDEEEKKLLNALMSGREKREIMNQLALEKEKLRANFNTMLDSISSFEELRAFKTLLAPAQPTLAALKEQDKNIKFPSKIRPVPHNKNIPHQRRLYSTKKKTAKKSNQFAKPDGTNADSIAMNLLYPSTSFSVQ